MISVILPTYNEAQNLRSLVDQLDSVLRGIPHELIVVDDDSPDRTWKVAERLAEEFPAIRVIRRVGRRGLSTAVIEGFDAAHGNLLAVMDADGQHDVALLHSLLRAVESGAALAVGSRYIAGGSVGDWVTDRRIVSRAGTLLAQNLSEVSVTDPLSGFFVLRKDLYLSIRRSLMPSGFKILLEILSHLPRGTIVREFPLIFRMRQHGESKLSFEVHLQFFLQVLRIALTRAAKFGPLFFGILAFIAVLVLLPRAWALRAMYFDPSLRKQVQEALVTVTSEQGWLVSDIELRSVSKEVVSIRHRDHFRLGAFGIPDDCSLLLTSGLLTCEKSLFL